MKREEIITKLNEIIKVYLPQDVDPTTVDVHSHLMQDLGINSAHLVDVTLDVEDAFNITLNERDMEAMQTVDAAVRIVMEKLTAA